MIMMHSRLYSRHDAPGNYGKPDVPRAAAIERVQQWLAVPTVNIIIPGDRHADILFRFFEQLGTAGNLATDAHLASLAVEYRAELASTDSDSRDSPGCGGSIPLSLRATSSRTSPCARRIAT